jgi:PKD domain-containing protein
MRPRGIGTAAVALALAAPTAAQADKTVQPGDPGCDAQGHCSSIQAAVDAAAAGETIAVTPGTWAGATISKSDLTLTGTGSAGSGQARVSSTLTFSGNAGLTLRRLVVLPSTGSALSVMSDTADPAKTVLVESSILSGSASAPAVSASSNLLAGTIAFTVRHVTIADAGAAPATAFDQNGGAAISATFRHSIVKGATPGVAPDATNDTTTADESLFADRATEDFRLRVGSPAIDQGAGPESSEIASDVDGEPRGSTWDRGGDEFVDHAPSMPAITASQASVRKGEPVGFVASGAGDPDTSLQDAIVTYRWQFGDGTGGETSASGTSHVYGAAGTYQATVRAVDKTGAEGAQADPVTVTVTDPPPPPAPTGGNGGATTGGDDPIAITDLPGFETGVAPRRSGPDTASPFLAITSPRPNASVRVRRATPLLRGRTADASGVRRVELALMRREGARCRWYDGRVAFRLGSCAAPRWFKALLDDFDWSYAFPRAVRPRPGSYFAFVRGTDYLGNASTAFTPATAIAFRYSR